MKDQAVLARFSKTIGDLRALAEKQLAELDRRATADFWSPGIVAMLKKEDKRRDEARAFYEGKRGNPWAYQRHSSGALTLTDHGVREWRK